jgi:hypothetical protein
MHDILFCLKFALHQLTAVRSGHYNYISQSSMNAPAGYTSVLPESSRSGEDSAYAMASAMQTRQERASFNDASVGAQLSSSPYLHSRVSRNQALAQSGPFTSAVSESSPTSDAAANHWASTVFMDHGNSVEKVQNSRAAQLRRDSNAREQQLTNYGQVSATSRVHMGQSAAVREGPAKHDQRAWGWAVEALEHHRDQVQRAKFVQGAAAPAAPAAPSHPAQLDTKLQRMYKLRAARKAMIDVHRTTQQGESHDFAKDQEKAKLRESEVFIPPPPSSLPLPLLLPLPSHSHSHSHYPFPSPCLPLTLPPTPPSTPPAPTPPPSLSMIHLLSL